MKILVIHNYHRKGSASGDDLVYNSEIELLKKHGHKVIRYYVRNDEFDDAGPLKKMALTLGMFWSFENYRKVRRVIEKYNPDVVHVHTFFPLLSPSILYAAKKSGKKVVATLHDTRFICPCATSICHGKLCNECMDGHYSRMIKRKCFKDSMAQSFMVSMVFKFHRLRRSFYNQIDKYICLNDNQIELLKQAGFDEEKITKKYNFTEDTASFERPDYESIREEYNLPERFAVFYGRIGEEEGIKLLMKAWNKLKDIPLVVMGAGPMEEEFKKWCKGKDNVYFLGYTKHDNCLEIVRSSEFVVFPSIWYEGCSMVVIETESLGKAIVATDIGFMSEAVRDGVTGYKFRLKDVKDFRDKVQKLWNDEDKALEMGENAREDFESKYTVDNNYRQLMEIYNTLV